MAEGKSCTKRATNQFSLHQQSSCKKETLLRGEKSILELISMSTPLPAVLNRLCAAIGLQIGNVVSVILLSDDHKLPTITHNAVHTVSRFHMPEMFTIAHSRIVTFSDIGVISCFLQVT